MSYRRDADITVPYGKLVPLETDEHVGDESQEQHKDTLACCVVSNFQNHHRRIKVYRDLKKFIPIKVYGHATGNRLNSKLLLPAISRCFFYLAFENSDAKDNITEKLRNNGYKGWAVPVVLGSPINDYKAVAPNHSFFIHVDEFASMKVLGNFVQLLSKDMKRYNEYFTWKKQWKVKAYTDWRERSCDICLKFNSLPEHKLYLDLETWDKTGYTKASATGGYLH